MMPERFYSINQGGNTPEQKNNPIPITIETIQITGPLETPMQDSLNVFINNELSNSKPALKLTKTQQNREDAIINNAFAIKNLLDLELTDNGILTLAKNKQTQEIIGFATRVMNGKHEEKFNYIGISTNKEYQGKHLGILIAIPTMVALSQTGESGFTVYTHDRILSLMTSLNLSYHEVSLDPTENPLLPGNHKIWIDINKSSIQNACAKIGIDPTQDPFTTTYAFTI